MTDQSFEYLNINAAGTYTPIATTGGSTQTTGILHLVTIAKASAQAVTLYDGTAATGRVIQAFPASVGTNSYFYDIVVTSGLTIVAAASYAGDMTVVFSKGMA